MDATATLQRPQFFRTFQEALHLSWIAYKRSKVIIAFSLIGGFLLAAVLPEVHTAYPIAALHKGWDRYQLIQNLVLEFASMAPCIRLLRPAFRFTPHTLCWTVLYCIATAFLSLLGFIALVLPGLYIATRLSLTGYVYLFGERGDPLRASWSLTRGYVLETFLYCTSLAMLQNLVSWLAGSLIYAAVSPSSFAAVLFIPIAAAFSLYGCYIMNTGLVMLADRLIQLNSPSANPA